MDRGSPAGEAGGMDGNTYLPVQKEKRPEERQLPKGAQVKTFNIIVTEKGGKVKGKRERKHDKRCVRQENGVLCV